jgi:hypothetical protein
MTAALITNIVLSALVFTAVIALIARAITTPRSPALNRRRQTARTSTPAASRIRTPAIGGSDR